MRRLFTSIFFLHNAGILLAQNRPPSGSWLSVQLPVNITKHWQWHNDAGYRTLGFTAEPLQYLFRTGIRYSVNPQWSVASGVAFFYTRTSFSSAKDVFGREFRFWEELNHQEAVTKKLQWQLRFRAEQRFFPATPTKNEYTGFRFRLRSGLTQKINSHWGIQLAGEYFQQAAFQKFSFDQNRLMLSGLYSVNSALQFQAGYMWLRWPRDNQHIVTFGFSKTFSLHGD